GDEEVLIRAHHALAQRDVRRESGLEHESRLGPFESRQARLELLMDVHRADDGAYRGRADAVALDGPDRGCLDLWMIGQGEVVVGGQIDDALPVDDGHGLLRAA